MFKKIITLLGAVASLGTLIAPTLACGQNSSNAKKNNPAQSFKKDSVKNQSNIKYEHAVNEFISFAKTKNFASSNKPSDPIFKLYVNKIESLTNQVVTLKQFNSNFTNRIVYSIAKDQVSQKLFNSKYGASLISATKEHLTNQGEPSAYNLAIVGLTERINVQLLKELPTLKKAYPKVNFEFFIGRLSDAITTTRNISYENITRHLDSQIEAAYKSASGLQQANLLNLYADIDFTKVVKLDVTLQAQQDMRSLYPGHLVAQANLDFSSVVPKTKDDTFYYRTGNTISSDYLSSVFSGWKVSR